VQLCHVKVNGRPLYWLDEMLEGGIEIPTDLWEKEEGSPSFIVLLAGPPGTGKTTFALELCYNLARFRQPPWPTSGNPWPSSDTSWRSLYVSSETPGHRIIENAGSLGWTQEFFHNYSLDNTIHFGRCNVYGNEHLQSPSQGTHLEPSVFFQQIAQIYTQSAPRLTVEQFGRHEAIPPDVVVLDSLNVLWPPHPTTQVTQVSVNLPDSPRTLTQLTRPLSLLDTFYKLRDDIGGGRTSKRPKLLIVILDSYFDDAPSNPWEFLADAAIRFEGIVGPENYFMRAFQIVKIKTQTPGLTQTFRRVNREHRVAAQGVGP
jgi:KaiC/GvpD/RAD55 family RecA-like ATPase